MTDQYEIVTFRGHRFDKMTVQALLAVEQKLGYLLTVLQGSYNAGQVSASSGTHDGGGACDLAATDHVAKVRAAREVGFAAWYRPTLSGVWNEHCHLILLGNEKASPSAKNQMTAYRNHRDGLSSNLYDPTWHPDPIKDYVYKVDPYIGVSLSNLQIDFINAIEGHASNTARRRVEIVQKRLNAKIAANPLTVDGIVGPKTVEKWGYYEALRGVVGRARVPDEPNLTALLKGTIYYVAP